MKIEVRIIPNDGDDKLPESDRPTLQVETHERRGDAFTVQRNDSVPVADKATTFTIPEGGRLVLNAPSTREDLVYDRDQGAAVRGSRQAMPHRADSPVVQGTRGLTAGEAAARQLEGNPTNATNTNPTPTGNTQPASNVPADNAVRAAGGNADAQKQAQVDAKQPPAHPPGQPGVTQSPSGSRITAGTNTPNPSSTEKK